MSALGFDTSNYTASVAWTDGNNVKSERRLLEVKKGERGLRQSEGVFQHVKLIPELFEKLAAEIDMKSVTSVGVSTRPRNIEGSYMPVFLAGSALARTVGASLGVRVYEFSHQDGHIMAGIYSSGSFDLLDGEFISVHLSGGTTEVLKSAYDSSEHNFRNKIIGATDDISAGQLIDRVGVKMGLSFPAGRELEALAQRGADGAGLPVCVKGTRVNFSGAETQAIRLVGSVPDEALAKGVLDCVSKSLALMLENAMKETGLNRILIAGGVISNNIIRTYLTERFGNAVRFASPEYASDNAVGIAYLSQMAEEE